MQKCFRLDASSIAFDPQILQDRDLWSQRQKHREAAAITACSTLLLPLVDANRTIERTAYE
jgi:hypothetical protein